MWKKIEKNPAPMKEWVKVKRELEKGEPEYESIGMATGGGKMIIKNHKAFNREMPTHWEILK